MEKLAPDWSRLKMPQKPGFLDGGPMWPLDGGVFFR